MKAGTRSLYEYLRAHPQIVMSDPKELHFFTRNRDRGRAWYEQHFSDLGENGTVAAGEASPSYSRHPTFPGAAERMHALLPEARLIYLVRQPVDRIQSHYQHELRKGHRLRPIDEEVLLDPTYVATSSYAMQLDQYLAWYPRERLLVITSDALRTERVPTMASVFAFVGVDPSFVPPNLDVEYSQAAGKTVTRGALRGVRRNPVVAALAERTPAAVRARIRRRTGEPADAAAYQLSKATRADLGARLAADVGRLRGFLSPDWDGWGLA
jgi:hypothetical protein